MIVFWSNLILTNAGSVVHQKIDEMARLVRNLDFGNEWAANFLLKTSDLAYEIAEILKLIKKTHSPTPVPVPDKIETIVLKRGL